MDEDIAKFMLLAAKFEFFLVNLDQKFAHLEGSVGVVKGVNWDRVGLSLENEYPFDMFDFSASGFEIFVDTVPQRLVVKSDGGLKWDSEVIQVSSWPILLRRSYAQLRNNVAHGNKAQLPAQFTHSRTLDFLKAGCCLIHFIASAFSDDKTWSYDIQFR